MNEKILAVIVSYNPDEAIICLYNSIKEQIDKLIIIDNATTNEESKKHLQYLANKGIQIIYNDKNYGVAKALNQGAKYAIDNGYKWLLTLDQDSEFLPNTYNLLISSYNKLPNKDNIMLIAPKYIEKTDYHSIPHTISSISESKVNWKEQTLIITSGSLIKTEVFDKIGFFEEKLFIDNVDFDFCLRLHIKGYSSKVAENIYFIHNIGHKYTKFCVHYDYSPIRRYYMARNSVYILRKYFFYIPKKSIVMVLKSGILLSSVKVILFEKDKLKKVYSSYKGLIDGILNKF